MSAGCQCRKKWFWWHCTHHALDCLPHRALSKSYIFASCRGVMHKGWKEMELRGGRERKLQGWSQGLHVLVRNGLDPLLKQALHRGAVKGEQVTAPVLSNSVSLWFLSQWPPMLCTDLTRGCHVCLSQLWTSKAIWHGTASGKIHTWPYMTGCSQNKRKHYIKGPRGQATNCVCETLNEVRDSTWSYTSPSPKMSHYGYANIPKFKTWNSNKPLLFPSISDKPNIEWLLRKLTYLLWKSCKTKKQDASREITFS